MPSPRVRVLRDVRAAARSRVGAGGHCRHRPAGRRLFFRAPAGFRSPLLDPVLAKCGMRYVSWTRRGYDAVRRDPRGVLQRLTRGLVAGDVLVLHDGARARTHGRRAGRARRAAGAARSIARARPEVRLPARRDVTLRRLNCRSRRPHNHATASHQPLLDRQQPGQQRRGNRRRIACATLGIGACNFETVVLDTWIGQVAGLDDRRRAARSRRRTTAATTGWRNWAWKRTDTRQQWLRRAKNTAPRASAYSWAPARPACCRPSWLIAAATRVTGALPADFRYARNAEYFFARGFRAALPRA